MNALERYHLRRFCEKHELDTHHIDSEISYWENKNHLKSLVPASEEETYRIWTSQEDRYMKENFLSFYVGCILSGQTRSEQTGVPRRLHFSLAEWVIGNG